MSHIKQANDLLAAADTADVEDCEVCAALDDFCVIHQASALGASQMHELMTFVLEEPEGAWEWMQGVKRQRSARRGPTPPLPAEGEPSHKWLRRLDAEGWTSEHDDPDTPTEERIGPFGWSEHDTRRRADQPAPMLSRNLQLEKEREEILLCREYVRRWDGAPGE